MPNHILIQNRQASSHPTEKKAVASRQLVTLTLLQQQQSKGKNQDKYSWELQWDEKPH